MIKSQVLRKLIKIFFKNSKKRLMLFFKSFIMITLLIHCSLVTMYTNIKKKQDLKYTDAFEKSSRSLISVSLKLNCFQWLMTFKLTFKLAEVIIILKAGIDTPYN